MLFAAMALPWFLETPFGAPPVLLAIALAIVTPLALPKPQRRFALGPIYLLGLTAIFVGVANAFAYDTPPRYAFLALAELCILCAIARSVTLIVVRSAVGQRFVGGTPKIFLDLAQGSLYVFAVAIVLRYLEIEPAQIFAGSAVVTAVLGFALKDTLGNLFAGLAIHAQRPFEVEDWIQFDEFPHHVGRVIEINWRATKVITLDEVEVVVPNASLALMPIRNFTKPEPYSRRSIYVYAPFETPPQRVQKIILDAVSDAWGVLPFPAPSVVTNAYTERGVEYWVRIFTKEFGRRDKVDGGVRDRIWYAFERHGVLIPPPQRKIELREHTPESEEREARQRAHERVEILRCVDWFAKLPDDVVERLAGLTHVRLYGDGELITRQGEIGYDMFILLDGEVEVLYSKDGGPFEVVDRLKPRAFFGEASLMTGEERNATIKAAKESKLLVVSKAALQQLVQTAPAFIEIISETIAHRKSRAEQWSADQKTTVSEETQSSDLLQRIREFFAI